MSIISQSTGIDIVFGQDFDARLERVDANTIQLVGVPGTSKRCWVRDTVIPIYDPITLDTDSASEYIITGSGTVAKGGALSALTDNDYNNYGLHYVYLCNDSACWNFSGYDRRRQLIISAGAPMEEGGYLSNYGDGANARHVGWVCLNSSRTFDGDYQIHSMFNSKISSLRLSGDGSHSVTTQAWTYGDNTTAGGTIPLSAYVLIPRGWKIIANVSCGIKVSAAAWGGYQLYSALFSVAARQKIDNADIWFNVSQENSYDNTETQVVRFITQTGGYRNSAGSHTVTSDDTAEGTALIKLFPPQRSTGFTREVYNSVSPDYTPPSLIYKGTDEIYIPKGRYHMAGLRFEGQYQDVQNICYYWDVPSRLTVGITSSIVGGKVNSSWYSVFMTSVNTIQLLPFIRVDTISYSNPNTTIAPASNSDGTTAENGWITANDIFNTYRLVLINDDSAESGNVYTIADCSTGTPDGILISGDVTSQIAITEWLQMIPPDGTPFLYLGSIQIDGSGNLLWFKKDKWHHTQVPIRIDGCLGSGAVGNTDFGPTIPPTARSVAFYYYVSGTSNIVGLQLYVGSSGSSILVTGGEGNTLGTAVFKQALRKVSIPLTSTALVRNAFFLSDATAPNYGWFYVEEFTE